MSPIVLIVILIVHLVLAIPFLFARSSQLHKRKEYLIPIFLVPVFGPLMAITIEILFILDSPGTKPVELEALKLEEEDIFWTSFVKSHEERDVIPLEEAMLINNTQSRRKAVLNTFREDSLRYLDVLMVARNNDDVDTTHYATIQISKIQRQFQLKLQTYAAAFEKDPDNMVVLDEYIDLLGSYIQSPLPEKSILQHQRKQYAQLLDDKLSRVPNDRDTLIKKLHNCTDLREDYDTALQIVELLKQHWPEDEQTWVEAMRVNVEWQDQDRIRETIQEMQSRKVSWTKHGREQVRPWVQL